MKKILLLSFLLAIPYVVFSNQEGDILIEDNSFKGTLTLSGQSFTATKTTKWTALSFEFHAASTGTLKIYAGNTVIGTPIHTQPFNVSAGQQEIVLTTSIDIVQGQQYTAFTNVSCGYYPFLNYAGGTSFTSTIAFPGDLWMKVTTLDTTAPVFENSTPSSVSSTATGFALNTDINEAGTIYYVVVADGTAAPTSVEVKTGTSSGQMTSGNTTVSLGGFTNNFSVTGLTASTAYDVYVVAEDDEGTPNLQATPTKIDVATIATKPTVAANTIILNSISTTSMTVGWTNGNGARRIVIAKSGLAVSVDPIDGNGYTPNAVFGSGTDLGSSNFVVYDGTGTSVALTGLTSGTTYHFKVIEVNGSSSSSNYFLTGAPTGKQNSQNSPFIITSIKRSNPTDATTSENQVVFRVTFAKSVKNVDVTDFALSGTSAGDGTISSISTISSSVYDVTVTGITSSNGTLNLDIKGNGGVSGSNDIIESVGAVISQTTKTATITRAEFGQSFTASATGNFIDATLYVNASSSYSGAATMELRSGEGLGGSILATEVITIVDQAGAYQQKFTFSTPAIVTSASIYTLRFSGAGAFSTNYTLDAATGDPLAGGVIYQPTTITGADLTFEATIFNGVGGVLSTTGPSIDQTYTILNDTTKPIITVCASVPTDISANASCQGTLPDLTGGVTATDNSGVTPVITQSPAVGATLGLGTTTITFTATDGAGNKTTCTVNQTVADSTKPSVTCPGNQTGTPNGSGNYTLPDYTGAVTATDNCSGSPTVMQSPTAGTIITATTTITMTATDGSSNAAQCTFDVVLQDNTAPTFENSTPSSVSIAATSFILNTDINEAGTIYYVVVADGAAAPTSAEVKYGTGSGGSGQIKNEVSTVSTGDFTNAFSVTGLIASTAYDVYVVAEDDEGTPNVQTTPTKIDVETLNTHPTFTSIPVTTINEGSTYAYDITTNDVDGDAITVTETTLPSWLILNPPVGSVLAGGVKGFNNGTGTVAQFDQPSGVVIDASGNVYVADSNNHKIRKISPLGVVTTLAGSTQGFADGDANTAKFNNPHGIALDALGNIYVADLGNHKIRKISHSTGIVSTIAGSTQGFTNGTGLSAQFDSPSGVAVDNLGNVYVADRENHKIRKISHSTREVSTLAGSTQGFANGAGLSAQFDSPYGVDVDTSGNLYVADYNNHKIRKISTTGFVSTLAGGNTGGFSDGTGITAKFSYPTKVDVDASGNVYVADLYNEKIRKVTPTGVVTTLVGEYNASPYPVGIAVASSGDVFVADYGSHEIGKISQNKSLTGTPTAADVGIHNVVLKAVDGNGGITNQSFTITVNDITAPTITKLSPLDNATGVVRSSNLLLTFNENIVASTGNITIHDASNDNLVETIAVGSSNVSITNKVATINPTVDLVYNKNYYVQVAVTAFKDMANNNFAGITDKTTWKFATELRIAPTITFTNINKTYGDANFNLAATSNSLGTITYSIIGVANGTSLSGINNEIVSLGNAATITVRATQVFNGMYTAATKDITLKVGKATITATADDKEKTYGDANPAFTLSYSGFKGSDSVSDLGTAPIASSTASVTTNVGAVDINLTSGSDINYNITTAKGTLTIGKATLVVTAQNTTVEYGDNFSIEFEYGVFKNGEDSTVLNTGAYVYIVGSAPYNVGTYPIIPDAVDDNNYIPSYVNGTLTINKATLTATADDKSREYGEVNPAFTISYAGFKGSDSLSDLNSAPMASSTADATTNVGTSAIELSNGTDANYTITTVNGTLTISKASQTITFGSLTHDMADVFDLTATASSGLPVTYTSSDTSVATISGVTITILSAGSVTITASQTGNNNYEVATSVDQVLNISALGVIDTKTALSFISVYPNPTSNYIKIDLKNGKNVNVRIYTILGKLVLEKKEYSSKESLNISNLSNGIYTIRITDGNKEITKKIIKN